MHNTAKLLDCTLRDGAYLVDKEFGNATIHGIIDGLQQSKVDIIEIGFLQNEGMGDGKTVFFNSKDAKKFVPTDKKGCLFTVLADYSRYSIDNLDKYDGTSIDAVRACFFKHERFDVLPFCRKIKEQGYMCFVQPVDILGYSDEELIDLIKSINEIEPYCLSIVDTFGSMYIDDLERIFSLIHHNLVDDCYIGFHSHNNMQMSSALSQAFLNMAQSKRNVIVDATISGMGRGAGNTPTELIAQYMVQKQGAFYNIDAILDLIDTYMNNIKSKCTWGYSAPYFVAGCYGAHVNNVTYLNEKNSIRSKDIRYILNKIGVEKRKRYDYSLLEETYFEYVNSNINDTKELIELQQCLTGKNILILAPGNSVNLEIAHIQQYKKEKNAICIAINFIPELIEIDFVYFSNCKRFAYWRNHEQMHHVKRILTSNLALTDTTIKESDIVVNFRNLIKCGWLHVDNSMLMLLRLLDNIPLASIAIAGFDGYNYKMTKDYVIADMELSDAKDNALELNKEIGGMLEDFFSNRIMKYPIRLLTASKFYNYFEGDIND